VTPYRDPLDADEVAQVDDREAAEARQEREAEWLDEVRP